MTDDSYSILREAQLINNDLGRHSVKCNFSTRLSGRFYQNCSLERHTMRRSRLSEMQSKRRRLERELMLEKRRVVLMRERLIEMENARELALDLIFAIQRGVLEFQALVRRQQAIKLLQTMKHRVRMREMIALFFQARYRGWRGRLRAASMRQFLREQLRNKGATMIQAVFRCYRQRRAYLDILLKRRMLRERSAVSIQAAFRGYIMQQQYRQEMKRRQSAALDLQRVFRGMNGRRATDRLRQELARLRAEAEEKPKRIPLHMRRYSTYGANANESTTQSQQRNKITPRRNSMLSRRRGSINLVATSPSAFKDVDENDSVATTITSLDSRQSRPTARRKQSWQPPPPRRVLAAANASSPSMKRRSTYSGGRVLLVPRTPTREKRKSIRSYATSDITREANKALDSGKKSSARASLAQPRSNRDLIAPINITDEACSIAEEVKELADIAPPTESEKSKRNVSLTIPEAASAFMKEVITESVINYNIHSALRDQSDDDSFREGDIDFSFLLENT